MSNYKFELDYKGVGELLRSTEVKNLMEEKAKAVQANCGELAGEYGVRSAILDRRATAQVYTDSLHAIRSNLVHNTLLEAMKI